MSPPHLVTLSLLTPDQIQDDLRGEFRGRLHIDAVHRSLYATDASPFEVVPAGVAIPEDAADLQALVKYAREAGVPLVARGAGTGLAGEALGPGLVVDLSVRFRRILEVAADRVTVEPGVTPAELDAALAPLGRRFAPDPASAATCTIGGMVATNASGGAVATHGYTRDHVLGLEVVWDTGDGDGVWGLGSGVWLNPKPQTPNPRTIEIRSQTAALLAEHREQIQLTLPHTRFNRCGYVLHDVLSPAGLDLAKLLVGSEGTLGFVTAATLRTVPRPGGVATTVVGFPSVDAAVRAGLTVAGCDGLVGCDLLDQRLLARTRTADPAAGIGTVPADVGAALVLTVEADTERDAVRLGRSAIDRLRAAHVHRVLADPAADPDGTARIRRFRAAAVSGLYALGPGPRPVAGCEDVAVPVEELPKFLAEVRGVLARFDVTASVLAHVPAGIVHLRPFVDLADDADRAKLWPVADAVHTLALALGGTVSGQHGTGIARTPWVEKQSGPLMPVFRELKRIFDPAGILNPGKIVGPDPSRPAWPLRVSGVGSRESGIGADAPTKVGPEAGSRLPAPDSRLPLLTWSRSSPQQEAGACNGCGDCRPRTGAVRMCPVFRADGDEAATPRAKANLIRTAAGPLTADEARAVAGLCVHCKMCRSECRAGVDVPKLMLEAKAAYHAEHGLPDGAWLPARAEALAALAGRFAFTANALLGNRVPRWLVEKVIGLSRHRTLPRFTHRTFLRRARRLGLSDRQGGRGGRTAELIRSAVRPPPSALRISWTPSPTPPTPGSGRRPSRSCGCTGSRSTSPGGSGRAAWPRWWPATWTPPRRSPGITSAPWPTWSGTGSRSSARSRPPPSL
ncbi:MAG: FAD-linked oxidase C-terminal domain-containing protein [Gemmataceae bacterium]